VGGLCAPDADDDFLGVFEYPLDELAVAAVERLEPAREQRAHTPTLERQRQRRGRPQFL
jgi:hypothetical protein